jgi:hypothetical protein
VVHNHFNLLGINRITLKHGIQNLTKRVEAQEHFKPEINDKSKELAKEYRKKHNLISDEAPMEAEGTEKKVPDP